MQLPEFKEREGTSMGGAYVSAAKVGNYGKVIANLRQYTPQEDPNAMAKMQLAKGSQYNAVLKVAASAYDAYREVKTAEEAMSLKAAQAEYKNHMASWVADTEANANAVDQTTGLARWETAQDDFDTASEQAMDGFMSKYRLDPENMSTRAALEWKLNTDSVNTTYKNNITGMEAKQLSYRALSSYRTGMEGATSVGEAEQLTSTAIESNAVNYDTGMMELHKWKQGHTFDTTVDTMPMQGFEGALSVQKEMISNTSNRAKLLTDTQRKAAVQAGEAQVENLHRQNASQAYTKGGAKAVMDYIVELDKAGPEGTYTVDQTAHDAMITELTTRFSQLKTREKAITEGQTRTSALDTYWEGSPATDAGTYVEVQNNKALRDDIDDSALELAKSPDFYALPEAGQAIRRGAESGYIAKPVVDRLEGDILRNTNINDVKAAVAAITLAEDMNPNVLSGMNKAARAKYTYIENYMSAGLLDESDPEKAVASMDADYTKYLNMSEAEVKNITAATKEHLNANTGISIDKRFESTAYDLGYTDTDMFSPDAVIANADVRQTYADAWESAYRMTRNQGAADTAAFKASMRVSGATTSYGTSTPIVEWNAPSAVLHTPGRPQGAPSQYIDQQHSDMIAALSADRVAQNLAPITAEDTRRMFLGHTAGANGEPAWLLVDYGGKAVVSASGKNIMLTYGSVDPTDADNAVKTTQVNKFSAMDSQQTYITNKHSLELPKNGSTLEREAREYGDTPRDRVQTPSEFNRVNRHDWKRMSDKKKEEATRVYFATYNALMDSNRQEADKSRMQFDQDAVDMKVRHYMSSMGYMHGDEKGKYIPPPEIR